MAEQMDTRAVDLTGINTPRDELKGVKRVGELVFGIRIDAVPESEAKRLADEGKFHPLTIDKNGFLRVVLPEAQKLQVNEQVQSEIRSLLEEIRDLLMEIA